MKKIEVKNYDHMNRSFETEQPKKKKTVIFDNKNKYRSSKILQDLVFDKEETKKTKTNRGSSKYYSKKITTKEITENTPVYDILFDIESEEKKTRNYEKVSNEIKKIEHKLEIEKQKLKKKLSLMAYRLDNANNKNINQMTKDKLFEIELNLRNKTLEMKELDKGKKLNFIDLIQKLRINPKERTIKDVLRIKPFIEKSNLVKTFYEEFTDINIVEKLIHFCCIEMYYKKYKNGEIIYKIGDIPDEFYSIIFGKVNMIKAIPEEKIMSGFEYFYYLMNLRKNDEIYLFHKTIAMNLNNYYIHENHIEIIHYIYLYNHLKSIKNKEESTNISFAHLLDLLKISLEEIELDITQINSTNHLINCSKLIKKKLQNIPEKILQKYSFLDDNIIKKNVTIYKQEICESLKVNDFFGDDLIKEEHALTAISENSTELAALPIKLYNSEIANLKSMILEGKISDLHSSHFFNKMKYYKFRKKYYNLFLFEKFYNGDILFKEGEEIKKIYFIKEGKVELYTSKSMNEIESLMALLIKKKKSIQLNDNSQKTIDDKLNYSNINSSYDDLVNFLEQKQKNKLLFLTKNEEIGLVSNFLGSHYLTSCSIVSKEAKIYSIDVKYINQMLNEEYECVNEYNFRIEQKLNLLIQRLFKANNIKLIMIDEKINLEKDTKKCYEEQQKLLSNSSKIKALVNYNKLNNILTESAINNPTLKNLSRENSPKLPLLSKNIRSPQRKISLDINISNKENSKDLIKSKNYNFSFERRDKIEKTKIINKSRNQLLLLLGKNSSLNSGIKKSKKIKLEKKKNSGFNHQILEKLFITPPTSNNVSLSQNINNNRNTHKFITFSYDNNLNINKNLFNNKNKQENEGEKNYNRPYVSPKILIKKDKYKIFDNNSNNKKIQFDNLKMQLLRLKQMKNIHSTNKNINDNYEYSNDFII